MERAGKNCLSLVLTEPFSKLYKVLAVTPAKILSKFEFKKWLFAMNFRIQDSETKKYCTGKLMEKDMCLECEKQSSILSTARYSPGNS